jgi:hypothetical protein
VFLTIQDGWRLAEAWHGTQPITSPIHMPPNDALVLVVSRMD